MTGAARVELDQTQGDPVARLTGAFVLAEVGEIEKLVHAVAAWLTLKVVPATLAVDDRAAPVFAVHDTVVVPGPVPLEPDGLSDLAFYRG